MTNILSINPLLSEIIFSVFLGDETRKYSLVKNLDTSITFPKMLVEIIDNHNIDEIWCVTGPGPFTLMRIITLSINALKYTRNIEIRSCHFFDLIPSQYIPIIEANQKEYLIKKDGEIILIPKESLEAGNYQGIISGIFSTENIKYIQYEEDKNNIISVFSSTPCEIRIFPIYFKTPHITCPKH